MLLNRIFQDMDRLFERMDFGAVPGLAPFPPLNVWEDEGQIVLEAQLPGMKIDDIQVTLTGGDQLTLAGERKWSRPDAVWHRQECDCGRFARTVTLPMAVDGDRVEARYDQGILTLTLPKSEAAKPRRISVRSPQEAVA